jgi:Domain of Unknown Function (DUF1080)
MDKKTQLKKLIKQCEEHFGHGTPDSWRHSEYNDFSKAILNKTKVNISTSTLKRIFGKVTVDDDYQPQQATIDALKEYCNYLEADEISNNIEDVPANEAIPRRPGYKLKVLGAIGILIAILSLILVLNKNTGISGTIKMIGVEGELPKTCHFETHVNNYKDSVFIDFGDKSPFLHINPKQSRISHIYYVPGVFVAKLMNRDSIFAKTNVSVPSNKWLGIGFQLQRELPSRYYEFPAFRNTKDSLFHLPNILLHQHGVDTLIKYYSRLCNFTPIAYNADNFKFETTFKNDVENSGIYCNSVQFQISGSKNRIRINFRNPGCSSAVLNVISEQRYEGSNSDLSKFVLNLEQWNTVKIINKNKQLSVFVNGKFFYTVSYSEPLGDIRGILVEFERNGYVKSCSLKSLDGKILYDF